MYKKPGVSVDIKSNARVISLSAFVQVPAIVGLGPTTITVTDELVQRGTGSIDILTNTSGVNITQIANLAGLVSGSLNYSDNLYEAAVDYTSDTNGQITWLAGAGCPNNTTLTEGETYYVTYTYTPTADQYKPTLFTDGDDIIAKYGPESATTGILSIGGRIALENGAPAVYLVQVEGASYNEANYKAAIDKLKNKDNIGYVLAVFPSGGVSQTNIDTINQYLMTHANYMSQDTIRRERGAIVGDGSSDFVTSGGVDNIGDTTTSGTMCYNANKYQDQDVVYVAPTECTRVDAAGNTMNLNASVIACAVAGKVTGQPLVVNPITGQTITGITMEDDLYNDVEMNQLASANALVLYSKGGIIRVRHALTTDGTSADTAEISVVDLQRYVKRTVRTKLESAFLGKGVVVNDSTEDAIEATTEAILQAMVRDGYIAEYGTVIDAQTGQVPIKASQNAVEPRQIDLTFSYKPLYPLNWIVATITTYV